MYEFLKKLFKEVDGQPEAITAEELIKRIQADSKLKIVNLEDGGYVAKEKLDAKITELSGVKKQLDDANKEIQSYKDMDIEGIKKSAQEWENKYKTDTAALNDKLTAQERKHQTDMFFSGYEFTSKAAQAGIRMEFDKKEFKLEDGVFQGASDYMKSLMENEDYKGAFVLKEDKPDETDQGAGTGAGAGGNQKPLPTFATGSIGGNAGAGTDKNIFNFGFHRLREPEKTE